ncbi:HipA domain-containing protein [Glutamicibacter sp. MNS18]|uniref:type II toxin-antitoxin system HipA family toxin n=1 Tax=Glutamicibacter sp. MNS18 TaxID=2989817 RepID=UPI0022367500|nr:HipA domain-containing protein [Glutamicibacter sp. MNS18]MCW4464929.1 HipA domain-containing protein [Glutamicibacter sp. MNS18]
MPVFLYDEHVGLLIDEGPNRVGFRASARALSRHGLGSTALSLNLPLGVVANDVHAATSFFGGILPEGRGRQNLARQAGVPGTDLYAMLNYAGTDVPGAVVIGPYAYPEDHELVPAGADEIEAMLNRTADYAMGMVGGGGSLPGIQPKAVLTWNEGWYLTSKGASSTHILKPVAPGQEWGAQWEAYCLALGRSLGLTSFEATVQGFGQRTALVVERYDRIAQGRRITRLHQEDAAQALGLPWDTDAKFEAVDRRASHANVANLLPRVRKLAKSRGPRHRLLAYMTFNVAIGNTDAHAKNFSLLHLPDGGIDLAPLYDVTALALAPDGQQNMALRVNGKAHQPSITLDDLVSEAETWGIGPGVAREIVSETLQGLLHAVEVTDHQQVTEKLVRYISVQTRNLLAGRKAAVSDLPAYLGMF